MVVLFKDLQARLSRGRRSRNKVSVGEPAEGSLSTVNSSNNRIVYLIFTSWNIKIYCWVSYSSLPIEIPNKFHLYYIDNINGNLYYRR